MWQKQLSSQWIINSNQRGNWKKEMNEKWMFVSSITSSREQTFHLRTSWRKRIKNSTSMNDFSMKWMTFGKAIVSFGRNCQKWRWKSWQKRICCNCQKSKSVLYITQFDFNRSQKSLSSFDLKILSSSSFLFIQHEQHH